VTEHSDYPRQAVQYYQRNMSEGDKNMMNNPMNRLISKTQLTNKRLDILTWIGEFRPENKTIWVVVDEESDWLGPRM